MKHTQDYISNLRIFLIYMLYIYLEYLRHSIFNKYANDIDNGILIEGKLNVKL